MSAANSPEHKTTLGSLRSIILAILVLGLIGTGAELLLLSHDEGALQLIPLVLMALSLLVIFWHLGTGSAFSLHVVRVSMVAFVVAGPLGVGLHYRGSAEFQREVDPSIGGVALFSKVIKSKAPPILAPGVMTQYGLLGLAYSFAFRRRETNL